MEPTKTNPKNPISLRAWNVEELAKVDPAVLAAHDAFEAHDPRAMTLLVGLPATFSVGSDRYATKVVKTTPCTITVEGGQTYRFTKYGWTSGRSYHLAVGYAEDYRDPSF